MGSIHINRLVPSKSVVRRVLGILLVVAVNGSASPPIGLGAWSARTLAGPAKDYCNRGLKEYHCVRVNTDERVVCGVSTKHRRDRGCCRYQKDDDGHYQLSECSNQSADLKATKISFDTGTDTYRVKTGTMRRAVQLEREAVHCAAKCATELALF